MAVLNRFKLNDSEQAAAAELARERGIGGAGGGVALLAKALVLREVDRQVQPQDVRDARDVVEKVARIEEVISESVTELSREITDTATAAASIQADAAALIDAVVNGRGAGNLAALVRGLAALETLYAARVLDPETGLFMPGVDVDILVAMAATAGAANDQRFAAAKPAGAKLRADWAAKRG